MPVQSIPLRKLGKDGPEVPALGFGLMGISIAYGTIPSDEERFKLLDCAVELGATFWDSSDLYGDNEELLGKWFKRTGKRNEIFLGTKFGFVPDTNYSVIDSSAKYCKESCEKSLKKLGVDYIDLYYLHRANPNTPIEETMRALAELKAEGKIKHIGLCELTSSTLRRAHKIAPVSVIQMEYSAFVLDIEGSDGSNMLATCKELGITVVPFAPLGRGLLTSTFGKNEPSNDKNDRREAFFPRFMEKNRDANVKLVNQFKELADKKNCTISQLALAWLLKQGDNIVPIPGTKRIKYLEENWGALDVHLTDEDEKEIRKFVENAEVAGGRNPEKYAKGSLIETREE